MFAHGNQAGGERHHRLHAKIRPPRLLLQRRYAVEDNAGTRPVEMRLRPQQNATRCRDRAQTRFAFGKGGENIQLPLGCATIRLIGASKVADNVHRLADVFTGAQALIEDFRLFRAHAQAVHTGIELHPDRHRLAQRDGFQRFKLFDVMNGGMQVLLGNRRQIGRVEEAFQQQDRLSNAALTQAQGLFKTGNAKSIGVGERSRGLEEAVSVSVRFHHRNQLAGRRQFTQTLQVVSQSAAVNDYSCRLHLCSLISVCLIDVVIRRRTAGPRNYRSATIDR